MKRPRKQLSKKRLSSSAKRSSAQAPATFPGDRLRVVFSEKQIQKRVQEMADQINRDFKGQTLRVVGILENCCLFMADLVRALKMPVICHFLKAEVNDSMAGNVAVREIVYTPRVAVAGSNVLLVDDILQSGVTLEHVVRLMIGRNANTVRTAVLIEKTEERKTDVATDYVGFKCQEKFLVGYGLGYQDRYRNLPYIATRI